MIVLYDNYDSFTYNLLDYLVQHGAEVKVIRNDQCSAAGIARLNPRGIVLSPGPGRPEQSGGMMELIASFHRDRPILGICLGHQALGCYFGARLVHAARPMHGKCSVIRHNRHAAFRNVPEESRVMRYHSLILEDLDPAQWEITARTLEGEIMAMAHRDFPLWGFQFHPESVLSEHGFQLVGNWLNHYILHQ